MQDNYQESEDMKSIIMILCMFLLMIEARFIARIFTVYCAFGDRQIDIAAYLIGVILVGWWWMIL